MLKSIELGFDIKNLTMSSDEYIMKRERIFEIEQNEIILGENANTEFSGRWVGRKRIHY